MTSRRMGILLFCAALFVGAAVVAGQARRVKLTATCGSGCDPAPVSFSVPSGHNAEGFTIARMVPGRACAGTGSEKLSGFSIRRGQSVVYVYYPGPRGIVSDPVPLGDLVLGPGGYSVSAAPAKGASITLEFEVVPQP